MAITKLSLYNDALLISGQRELSSDSEDRPSRHYLDNAYDNPSAIDACLELVKPRFASKTVTLSSPATSSDHALDSVHTLPADYIAVVGVYSDDKLDQPVNRYMIEDRTVVCEYDTIYLRYTTNLRDMANWTPSFANLVATYLARQIIFKLNPAIFKDLHALFLDTVESVIGLEGEKEPAARSSAPTVTLTNEWRQVYNDALFIMGLEEINTNTDDSNRRVKLDRTVNAGVVSSLLEETGWQFALKSTEITYDPSSDPDWGPRYAFEKPDDMHRLDGIFQDESMSVPLKRYNDEQSRWYCELTTIYVQYVSIDFLSNTSLWPTFFRRLVAARMAKEASASLRSEGADVELAMMTYEERIGEAKANDAMQSPPRVIAQGNWTKSRFRGGYRGRPGGQ